MRGVLEDLACDKANVLDVLHAADRSSGAGGTVHAAGVEFDDAFFVGQASEADAVVFGVVLAAEADVVRGFKRVTAAVEQHLVGLLHGVIAGGAGDDDRFRGRLKLLDGFNGLGGSFISGCDTCGSKCSEREEVAA